ncbi:hypothetical protein O181_041022 [Austropuccinia psidii MF-1]|uniref:Uncharacterized protein n=1 Tax=Austropuccinia psidii MF-1 TaxID=1389203 RepID=A0A9Q3DFY3_9BASI|nr:hypothetical protein [Austropuccinia psidii MF-1]
MTGSRQRDVRRWTNSPGSISTCERPFYASSEVPIPRINNQGILNRIRRIHNLPTNPDGEGSYKLDCEDFEAVDRKIGQPQNSSLSHPPSGTFQSQIIPSTPRNFQPRLAAVPSSINQSSPHPSTARPPTLASEMRPSPAPKYRPSPIPPFSNLQPLASTSNQSRAERLPLTQPSTQLLKSREYWHVRATREDKNVFNETQDAAARRFSRFDRNTR